MGCDISAVASALNLRAAKCSELVARLESIEGAQRLSKPRISDKYATGKTRSGGAGFGLRKRSVVALSDMYQFLRLWREIYETMLVSQPATHASSLGQVFSMVGGILANPMRFPNLDHVGRNRSPVTGRPGAKTIQISSSLSWLAVAADAPGCPSPFEPVAASIALLSHYGSRIPSHHLRKYLDP